MTNQISVVIPYRPRPHALDHRTFDFVLKSWTTDLLKSKWADKWEIVQGHDDSQPFNRSRARNEGAAHANGDILIFADADSIYTDFQFVAQGIEALLFSDLWVKTRSQIMLTMEGTEAFLEGYRPHPSVVEKVWRDTTGGIVICSRSQFDLAGGFDERFIGWGYEDTSFQEIMSAIHSPPFQFGDVYHLWHPKERELRQEQPQITANQQMYVEYVKAGRKGREAMLDLLSRTREAACSL